MTFSGGALALPTGPFGSLDSGGLHPRTLELLARSTWIAIAAAALAIIMAASGWTASIPVGAQLAGAEVKTPAGKAKPGAKGPATSPRGRTSGRAASAPAGGGPGATAGKAQSGKPTTGRSGGVGSGKSKPRPAPAKTARSKPAAKPAPAPIPAPASPVAGSFTIGDGLGAPRSGHLHAGVDLLAPAGTSLVAVGSGQVVLSGWTSGGGNTIAIYDPSKGRTYVYMHLNAPAHYGVGAQVQRGAHLGHVGCTGTCSGDHLHFEVRGGSGISGPVIDPMPMVTSGNWG